MNKTRTLRKHASDLQNVLGKAGEKLVSHSRLRQQRMGRRISSTTQLSANREREDVDGCEASKERKASTLTMLEDEIENTEQTVDRIDFRPLKKSSFANFIRTKRREMQEKGKSKLKVLAENIRTKSAAQVNYFRQSFLE